jgi:hypothetical protein
VKDWLRDQTIENLAYADEHGIDKPEIRDWKWTAAKAALSKFLRGRGHPGIIVIS